MAFLADKLVLFGATGDLSQRMLLPSLCALHADGLVPEDLQIIARRGQSMAMPIFGPSQPRRWSNFCRTTGNPP